MTSLKRRLVATLIGLLTVVGLLAGGISYFLAREDAATLLDRQLLLVARSIHEGSRLPLMQEAFLHESTAEKGRDFVIQVAYPDERVRVSRPDFELPIGKVTGYSDIWLQGQKWRVYTLSHPDRTVQLSQSDAVRQEIATNAALRTLLPIAGLLPLSWILVVIGTTRLLKPLDAATRAATERDAASLAPLPTAGVPAEVAPLIGEINALLGRVSNALDSQRNFILDAAHELRTPLAALQLQIENLSQNHSPADLAIRISELTSGLQRAAHLVDQLLKVARYETEKTSEKSNTDAAEIVKTCIGELIPIAEKRGIDLGMVRDENAPVFANADDLRILFANLIDNAIRYTPTGGSVDVSVSVEGNTGVVNIVDTGPGIPEHLLPRVFDRFFRAGGQETEGSGIGLAIVKAIANQNAIAITLHNRADRSGLIATASFPLV